MGHERSFHRGDVFPLLSRNYHYMSLSQLSLGVVTFLLQKIDYTYYYVWIISNKKVFAFSGTLTEIADRKKALLHTLIITIQPT